MPYYLLFLLLLLNPLALATGCRPAAPLGPSTQPSSPIDLLAEPTGELVEETWAVHLIRGSKVGHRHTRVFRLGDGTESLLQTVAVDHLELRRFGNVLVQTLTTASLETDAGQVRQIAYRVASGESVTSATGQIADGQLLLTRTGPGGEQQVRFDWPDKQQGLFAVERSLQRAPLVAGQRRSVDAFLPVLDRPVHIELVANGEEPVDVDGQSRSLLRIEAIDPRADSWRIPTVYWADASGRVIKTQEAFLNRETIAVEQARARQPNDLVRVDLGVDVGVRIDKPIDNPQQVKYAVYRVQVDGLPTQQVFPAGLSQQVLPEEGGAALVTVREVTPAAPAVVTVDVDPPQPDDLAPNLLVQSDHPHIVTIAESVAGSVEDPWFAARLLEHHVFGRLNKEDFSQVFGSAAEVAEQRRGDCSEHAVLLAALCRARGIPARVAVGLLYSAEDQRFLYHMWNEVWINDRWIPLDATLGNGGIGGCHLKLRDSSLAHETAYGMVSPVIYLIGRLHIDVVASQSTAP
jgi:hypothetical protein